MFRNTGAFLLLLAAAIVALRSKLRLPRGRRVVRWGLTFIATVPVGSYAVLPMCSALWIAGQVA